MAPARFCYLVWDMGNSDHHNCDGHDLADRLSRLLSIEQIALLCDSLLRVQEDGAGEVTLVYTQGRLRFLRSMTSMDLGEASR